MRPFLRALSPPCMSEIEDVKYHVAVYRCISRMAAVSVSALESSRYRGQISSYIYQEKLRFAAEPADLAILDHSVLGWPGVTGWKGELSLLVAPDASPWRTSTIDWSTIPADGT